MLESSGLTVGGMVRDSTKSPEIEVKCPSDNNQETLSGHCKNGFFSIISDIPKGIWGISLFGLFLGMSTTMVYSQLSLFLKNDLGLTVSQIANLDGIVESVAFITRIFSGPISDFFKERKLILLIGCFVTLASRSFLPMVTNFFGTFITQISERIGNGLQATPRDALIADLTPRSIRGKVFGFTRSVKTIGGLIGGVLAVTLMGYYSNNFRFVFKLAVIPVVIAAACLFFVKPTSREEKIDKKENPFKRKYLKSLDFSFWKLIALAFIFQLGHFTEHLFPIYMENFVGTRVACTVGTVINLGQICLAFTIGILADKFGKGKFIRFCIFQMFISNLLFLLAGHISNFTSFSIDMSRFFGEDFVINSQAWCVYLGAFLWGGQLSAIEGLFLAIISEQVSFYLRATAMGIYSLILGFGYWIASNLGGSIWESFGSQYTFGYSIFFCCSSFLLSFVLLPKKYNTSPVHKEIKA